MGITGNKITKSLSCKADPNIYFCSLKLGNQSFYRHRAQVKEQKPDLILAAALKKLHQLLSWNANDNYIYAGPLYAKKLERVTSCSSELYGFHKVLTETCVGIYGSRNIISVSCKVNPNIYFCNSDQATNSMMVMEPWSSAS